MPTTSKVKTLEPQATSTPKPKYRRVAGEHKQKSKSLRIAQVKALKSAGYSHRAIAKELHVSTGSIKKYLETTTETVSQYEDVIKKHQMIEDFKLAESARSHIEGKIDTADFRDLVGLFKIVREVARPAVNYTNNNQVNLQIVNDKNSIKVAESTSNK